MTPIMQKKSSNRGSFLGMALIRSQNNLLGTMAVIRAMALIWRGKKHFGAYALRQNMALIWHGSY